MSSDDPREERRRAFERETIPHLPTIHAAARRLARRPVEADDLVQETYLRAYRTFDSFRPGTNSRAWLFTILGTVNLNRARRAHREPELQAPEDLELTATRALLEVDWEGSFLSATFAGEWGAGEQVDQAMRKLSDDAREIVFLVDVDGLSYEEAAMALDCPVGTVRSRLSRARRALALELLAYARSLGFARGTRP